MTCIIKFSSLLLFLTSTVFGDKTDTLLNQANRSVASSIKFVRLADGKTLVSKDSAKALVPASTTKLITAAAALTNLAADFSYETQLFYTGQNQGGTISGDLVVRGSGDPFLVSEKLWEMAIDLKLSGLWEIKGDIVIDQSLFDQIDRDQGRMQAERYSKNAYDAPILPFAVNFNTFAVAATVDMRTGSPQAQIWPYPLPGFVDIEKSIKIAAKPSKLKVERVTGKNGSAVHLTGHLNPKDGIQKYWKSVSDGHKAAGEYLRSFLQAAGITVRGKVRVSNKKLGSLQPLYTIAGYPLAKSIEGLNKYSNNFIADMLTKFLGARDTGGQGTFTNGAQALINFLRTKVGVKSEFKIKNGSGLSLENRLSADQLIDLLVYMQKHIEVYPEFLASLPASGIDGTLKDRFKDFRPLQGKVRAKTGTLTQPVSVSSLAGYLFHQKHGWVAFAIIENGLQGQRQPSISELRTFQEKLIYSL